MQIQNGQRASGSDQYNEMRIGLPGSRFGSELHHFADVVLQHRGEIGLLSQPHQSARWPLSASAPRCGPPFWRDQHEFRKP